MLPLIRFGQYLAVSGLFGSSLFLLLQARGEPDRRVRLWVLVCGVVVAPLAIGGLWVQTAAMNGGEATPDLVWSVLSGMSVGYAAGLRAAAAVFCALLLTFSRNGARRSLMVVAPLGAFATGTLAWGGHGAADDGARGWVHLGADLVHLWAAGLWIGALVALLVMATRPQREQTPDSLPGLHVALASFSGVGTLLVAVLVLTGLVNSWFLIGPERVAALYSSDYGRLLSVKLALFVAMLGLAAANRWRLTPALGEALDRDSPAAALRALRTSLYLETGAGFAVLLLVGWLGTLAPPAAM